MTNNQRTISLFPFFSLILYGMKPAQNKPFYKVISLFIKSAILFLAFYYIWDKLSQSTVVLSFPSLFSAANWWMTLVVVVLMGANWGIEALKWKLLVAPLEAISFANAVKGVLSGVTISIFTPNRIGEFTGRVFFLEKADRLQATVMSLIGSVLQLAVTVVAGVFAFLFLQKKYFDFFRTDAIISTNSIILLMVIASAVGGLTYYWLKNKSERFRNYFAVLSLHSKQTINTVGNLSILRYLVFSVQYYFVLQIFGINAGIVILFCLIALTFFVTAAIPTFALTEIATRSGVAIYFFGTISNAHSQIFAASLFLWIINLAIPALMGSIYVRKLKFFKE